MKIEEINEKEWREHNGFTLHKHIEWDDSKNKYVLRFIIIFHGKDVIYDTRKDMTDAEILEKYWEYYEKDYYYKVIR